MTPPTLNDFLDAFPEFRGQPVMRTEFALKQAIALVSQCAFGDLYSYGVYLLTGHFLSSIPDPCAGGNSGGGGIGGQRGPVKSIEFTDDVTVSFMTPQEAGAISKQDAERLYGSTAYGREFERLKRSLIVPVQWI